MKKNRIQSIIIITILTFFAVATIFPFYIMLVTSTKSSVEFATNFWGIAKNPAWGNFIKAWKTVDKYVANSFIITITGTAAISVIAVLSGYAFAKLKFRFKEALYTIVVAFNIIPFALLLVPMFMNILKLGIVNTRSGVILPCIAMGVIMPVILSTSFFEGIPDALFEAARMDGAN